MDYSSANKYIFSPSNDNILSPVIATEEKIASIFLNHYKQLTAHIKSKLKDIPSWEPYTQKIAVYNNVLEDAECLDEHDRLLIQEFRDEWYTVDVFFRPSHGFVRVCAVYIKVSY